MGHLICYINNVWSEFPKLIITYMDFNQMFHCAPLPPRNFKFRPSLYKKLIKPWKYCPSKETKIQQWQLRLQELSVWKLSSNPKRLQYIDRCQPLTKKYHFLSVLPFVPRASIYSGSSRVRCNTNVTAAHETKSTKLICYNICVALRKAVTCVCSYSYLITYIVYFIPLLMLISWSYKCS